MSSENQAIHMAPVAAASPCDVGSPVIGWLGGCAVAVAAEKVEARGPEDLNDVRPQYLIAASKTGIPCDPLSLMQRVRCTVPRRPWTSIDEDQSRIVVSCEVAATGTAKNVSLKDSMEIGPDSAGAKL